MTTEVDSVDAKRMDQVTSVAENDNDNDNVQIVHPRIERFQCLVRINYLIDSYKAMFFMRNDINH